MDGVSDGVAARAARERMLDRGREQAAWEAKALNRIMRVALSTTHEVQEMRGKWRVATGGQRLVITRDDVLAAECVERIAEAVSAHRTDPNTAPLADRVRDILAPYGLAFDAEEIGVAIEDVKYDVDGAWDWVAAANGPRETTLQLLRNLGLGKRLRHIHAVNALAKERHLQTPLDLLGAEAYAGSLPGPKIEAIRYVLAAFGFAPSTVEAALDVLWKGRNSAG